VQGITGTELSFIRETDRDKARVAAATHVIMSMATREIRGERYSLSDYDYTHTPIH